MGSLMERRKEPDLSLCPSRNQGPESQDPPWGVMEGTPLWIRAGRAHQDLGPGSWDLPWGWDSRIPLGIRAGRGSPADLGEGVCHRLAALQQAVQPMRLLLEELHGLHLHPKHHPHLALQAGKVSWGGGGAGSEQAQGGLGKTLLSRLHRNAKPCTQRHTRAHVCLAQLGGGGWDNLGENPPPLPS